MIDRKEYISETSADVLVKTFSTENYKLLQVETNIIYSASVIDVIEGYDENGNPYSRFTYVETDEKDEPPVPTPEEELEDAKEALNILGVE